MRECVGIVNDDQASANRGERERWAAEVKLGTNRCPSLYALRAVPGLRSGLVSTRAPKSQSEGWGKAAVLAMLTEARVAQTEFMATYIDPDLLCIIQN